MRFTFKHAARWLAAVLCLAALHAQAAGQPQAGRDYLVLNPAQPVETGRKIEVLEIFSYACPHCNALEPHLVAWSKKMPKDAELRHLPAVFRADWLPHARIYYTLEAMNLLRLHDAVYDAVHKQGLDFTNDKTVAGWAAKQGVNASQFMAVYNSFSVVNKTNRAKMLLGAYHANSVPTLVIDGKYLTNAGMAGSEAAMFNVADQLIVRARQERRGR